MDTIPALTEDAAASALGISVRTLYRRLSLSSLPQPYFENGSLTPQAADYLGLSSLLPSQAAVLAPTSITPAVSYQSQINRLWERVEALEEKQKEHHAVHETDIVELKRAYHKLYDWTGEIVRWLAPMLPLIRLRNIFGKLKGAGNHAL